MNVAGTSEAPQVVLVRLEHDGVICCFKADHDGAGGYIAEIKNPGCILADAVDVDFAIDVFFSKRYMTAVKLCAHLTEDLPTSESVSVNIPLVEQAHPVEELPSDMPRVLKITKSQIVFR